MNGIPLDLSHIRAFRPWRKRNKIGFLMSTEEVQKGNPRRFGRFLPERKSAKVVLMDDPTLYEALHEFAHAIHWVTVTGFKYMQLDSIVHEQFAFNWLRNTPGIWGILSKEERAHAREYIKSRGGVSY
jgi:hypothetical protein